MTKNMRMLWAGFAFFGGAALGGLVSGSSTGFLIAILVLMPLYLWIYHMVDTKMLGDSSG